MISSNVIRVDFRLELCQTLHVYTYSYIIFMDTHNIYYLYIYIRMVVSNIFYVHPKTWGRFPFWLINVFQMGWFNHQLENQNNLSLHNMILLYWWIHIYHMGVSLNGGTPISPPKCWSFFRRNTNEMVVGYQHFRKPPYTSWCFFKGAPGVGTIPSWTPGTIWNPKVSKHSLGKHVCTYLMYHTWNPRGMFTCTFFSFIYMYVFLYLYLYFA